MVDEECLNNKCYILLFSDVRLLPQLVKDGAVVSASEDLQDQDFVHTSSQMSQPEVLGMEMVIPGTNIQPQLEEQNVDYSSLSCVSRK